MGVSIEEFVQSLTKEQARTLIDYFAPSVEMFYPHETYAVIVKLVMLLRVKVNQVGGES